MLATVNKVVGATVGVTGCFAGATALFIRNGLERHRALVPEQKANDVTDQIILPNGRRFGYFVPDNFDPARKTIVSIHGTPESAASLLHLGNIPEYAKLQAELAERDVQTIAIDRWGVGLSQFHDGPVADIASDVEALCDHLGVSKFMVGGASGAGPYMSACAALLDPQRCVGVAMDVPIGPRDLPFHLASDNTVAKLFNRAAWQTALIATVQKEVLGRMTAAQFVKSIEGLRGLCENDIEAVRRDVDAFVIGLKDSKYYQHGIAAHVQEHHLMLQENWQFDPGAMKNTHIFVGDLDVHTPIEFGHWYVSQAPEEVEMTVYEGYGHLSFYRHPNYVKDYVAFVDRCFQ